MTPLRLLIGCLSCDAVDIQVRCWIDLLVCFILGWSTHKATACVF